MKNKKIVLVLGIVVALFLYGCAPEKNNLGPLSSAHIHADIKVYVLSNPIDFSLPQYQLQDKAVHFEDRDGDVMHIHATGINLGYIFKTIRMNIDNECLTLDTGRKYCSNGNAELKVFVKVTNTDWKQIFDPANYIIQGSDKILVNYGSEDEEGIKKLMESVTSKAK